MSHGHKKVHSVPLGYIFGLKILAYLYIVVICSFCTKYQTRNLVQTERSVNFEIFLVSSNQPKNQQNFCPYFFDMTSFLRIGQNYLQKFRWFFGRFEDTKMTFRN